MISYSLSFMGIGIPGSLFMEGDGCYIAKLKWLAINGFPEIVARITCFTFLIRVKISTPSRDRTSSGVPGCETTSCSTNEVSVSCLAKAQEWFKLR